MPGERSNAYTGHLEIQIFLTGAFFDQTGDKKMRWTHRFGRRLALPSTLQVMHELRHLKLPGETLANSATNEPVLEHQKSHLKLVTEKTRQP